MSDNNRHQPQECTKNETAQQVIEQDEDMPPRSNLAPDPSTIIVVWPSGGKINTTHWSMLPDRWTLLNEDSAENLKMIIEDGLATRDVLDNALLYPSSSDYTRAVAGSLKKLVMNPTFDTLNYSQLFAPNQKQSEINKVTTWLQKRQAELVPLLEAFTTQVGNPGADIKAFVDHGYSDEFLAERIRFLAAFERVYSADSPLTDNERKVKLPLNLFANFETLQQAHHKQKVWTSPSKKEGEELKATSFAVSLLDKNWSNWNVQRKYNWWIPVAGNEPEIRYAHDMMVSHGITLFNSILSHGSTTPIDIDNPLVRIIERTNNLCITHIEMYWQLAQPALERKMAKRPGRSKERELQLGYVQDNMSICEQVRRDLDKARLGATMDRVMRDGRRISTVAGGDVSMEDKMEL